MNLIVRTGEFLGWGTGPYSQEQLRQLEEIIEQAYEQFNNPPPVTELENRPVSG